MAQPSFKNIRETVKYWWLFLPSGLFLLLIGIWVFASPVAAYLSLSIVFAVGILVVGIFETAFAVSARKSLDSWGWTLATGILDIVIGTYLLAYPSVTMAVLPFILGFWLLFRGFSAMGFAMDMRSYGVIDWGWLLFLGIATMFFAFMILAIPAFGVANIIIWTGLAFIVAGFFRIFIALRIRKLKTS